MRALVALGFLTFLGLRLIWQAISGDVMTTPLGEPIVPRWLYVVGGLAVLVFPVFWFFVWRDSGHAFAVR